MTNDANTSFEEEIVLKMAAIARENDLKEINDAINNAELHLEDYVTEYCTVLEKILEILRKAGVDLSLRENRDLKSLLQGNFVDVYMCLKLHLVFHLGKDLALQHVKLSELPAKFGSHLSDKAKAEVKNLPGARRAIDPGSKILEMVSY